MRGDRHEPDGLGAILGSVLTTRETALAVKANLPRIPQIASVWFLLGTEPSAAWSGTNWVRTAYAGTQLVRLAYGPMRTSARCWQGAFASHDPQYPAVREVTGRTPAEAFRAICDGLREEGWLLPGPDVPIDLLEKKP